MALALLAGCRAEPPRFEDDPQVEALRAKAAKPTSARLPPLKVALARVDLDYPLESDLDKDATRYPARLDTDAVRAAVARAVTLTSGLAAPRLEEGEGLEAAFAGAFKARDDLLIRPVFRGLDCAWGGYNARWFPNVLLFMYFWVPSFFVPDEDYALRGGLDLELYCVASERRLSTRRVAIDRTFPLDDFERGWSWTGIVTAPGTLDEKDWAKVGRSLTPLAEFEAGRAAAIEVGETLPAAVSSGALAVKDRTVFAYATGISRHAGRIAAPVTGAQDALGFAAFLERTAHVPKKNLRTLLDQAATLEAWERGFRDHLARARPDDVAVVYWSGVGAIGRDGEAYLAPYYADPEAIERTGISLARLRLMISKLAARRVVVLLDAAFAGQRPGARSLPIEGGAVPADLPLASWVAAADHKEVTLIVAAGPGQDAIDFEGAGRGLLTYFVEEGAAGRADANGDGVVTGGELQAYLEREVAAQAGLDGIAQGPRVYRQGTRMGALDPSGHAPWLPNADIEAKRRPAAAAPKG